METLLSFSELLCRTSAALVRAAWRGEGHHSGGAEHEAFLCVACILRHRVPFEGVLPAHPPVVPADICTCGVK
jgi:hypothetical protein